MILKKEKNSQRNTLFIRYEKTRLPRQVTQNDKKNTKGNGMEKHLQTSEGSPKENQIAYIAGLFDGEGTVDYAQRWVKKRSDKSKKYFCFRISCEIGMTDYAVLEWIHQTLGYGSFRSRKVPEGMKPQWRWCCVFRDSYKFAKLMLPHARVKYVKLKQIVDHYSEGT